MDIDHYRFRNLRISNNALRNVFKVSCAVENCNDSIKGIFRISARELWVIALSRNEQI